MWLTLASLQPPALNHHTGHSDCEICGSCVHVIIHSIWQHEKEKNFIIFDFSSAAKMENHCVFSCFRFENWKHNQKISLISGLLFCFVLSKVKFWGNGGHLKICCYACLNSYFYWMIYCPRNGVKRYYCHFWPFYAFWKQPAETGSQIICLK